VATRKTKGRPSHERSIGLNAIFRPTGHVGNHRNIPCPRCQGTRRDLCRSTSQPESRQTNNSNRQECKRGWFGYWREIISDAYAQTSRRGPGRIRVARSAGICEAGRGSCCCAERNRAHTRKACQVNWRGIRVTVKIGLRSGQIRLHRAGSQTRERYAGIGNDWHQPQRQRGRNRKRSRFAGCSAGGQRVAARRWNRIGNIPDTKRGGKATSQGKRHRVKRPKTGIKLGQCQRIRPVRRVGDRRRVGYGARLYETRNSDKSRDERCD